MSLKSKINHEYIYIHTYIYWKVFHYRHIVIEFLHNFYAMLNFSSSISNSSSLLTSLFSAESISVKSIINFWYVGTYLLEKKFIILLNTIHFARVGD